MSAQDPSGTVQSAEEFASSFFWGGAYEEDGGLARVVRERDAATRRAAIEECAQVCLDRLAAGESYESAKYMLGARDCLEDIRALADSGQPSDE